MRLREFRKLGKRIVDAGAWSDKRMPRTSPPFPLTATRAYRLGMGWRWRLVRFEVADAQSVTHSGRLLIAFHRDKQQYQAWLGLSSARGTILVGRLEWHESHPGWHAHVRCGEIDAKAAGLVKPSGVRKLKRSAVKDFVIDDVAAVGVAEHFYGFKNIDPPLSGPQQQTLFGTL